jgi:hypothetical protein
MKLFISSDCILMSDHNEAAVYQLCLRFKAGEVIIQVCKNLSVFREGKLWQ